MADAKLSALTAATTPLTGAESVYVVQGGVSKKGTAADLLKVDSGAIVANAPVIDVAQTWNNGSIAFTGLKFNVTNTNSSASSRLLDLQKGGTSMFWVTRDGNVSVNNDLTVANGTTSVNILNLGGGFATLVSTANGVVEQRSGSTPQTSLVFNTRTDASNYETAKYGWNTNVLEIGAQALGSGTVRAVKFLGASFGFAGAFGYATGQGGTITQLTNRTTGVTLNTLSGAITLFAAAGSATPASFLVTNSTVGATDTVIVNCKSATTNKYAAIVTALAAGSFEITFWAVSGTTSDSPVFNFNVIRGVVA